MEFEVRSVPVPEAELDPNNEESAYFMGSNITKIYANGFKAVNNVSFHIGKGKCLGLVGESGCGKSTLARCILSLEKINSGEIWLNTLERSGMHAAKGFDKCRDMQIVFQNPTTALNRKRKIIDSLLEPLDYQKDVVPDFLKDIRDDRRAMGKRLLEMMDLPERYLDMYPPELSGGQKQRITIARAISISPHLIILDEPTSGLDVSVQAKVLNLLKDLQEQLKLTYLFISHDLSAVNFMSDKVMVMYKGTIVDRFEKETIFSKDRHVYTRKLLEVFDPEAFHADDR
jgi:peptide/nickel transport system ATP-binding protein